MTPAEIERCKVCGGASPLHGVVDFNKSCLVFKGSYVKLSGIPVWYYRCDECGFLFACQFDDWTREQWMSHVYGEGYESFDPDGEIRARANAPPLFDYLERRVARYGAQRVLDFGGGRGELVRLLRDRGVDAILWDPVLDGAEMARPPPLDVITAFEVFEHTTTPRGTLDCLLALLKPEGALLFSTLTLDGLPPQACDHWYIAPRNGHVSLHTQESLRRLFAGTGWRVAHLNGSHHMAVKEPG